MNNYPYTNTHELNLDWILNIVKDFENDYKGINDALDDAIAAINARGEANIEDLNAAKALILAAINGEKNTAISAIDAEKDAAILIINNVLSTIPTDYADLSGKMTIIGQLLQINDAIVPTWVQGSYAGGSLASTSTVICSEIFPGPGGLSLTVTNQTNGIQIKGIRYFTGYDADTSKYTGETFVSSAAQEQSIIFPASAKYFSVEMNKANGASITPSGVTVAYDWHNALSYLFAIVSQYSDVVRTDMLYGADKQSNAYIRGDSVGSVAYVAGYTALITYIPVEAGQEYTLARNQNVQGAFYNSSKVFVEGIINNQSVATPITLTAPATAAYMRISCKTEYLSALHLYKGVYPEPSINAHVPEMVEAKNTPANPTTYQSILPDVNDILNSSIYRLYFSVGSTEIPAHLPTSRWVYRNTAALITLGKDDARVTGTDGGTVQIFVTENAFFWRQYTTEWEAWKCVFLNLRVGTGYDFNATISSLTEAVAIAGSYKNVTIEVGAGNYDLITEFETYYGDDFFTNFTDQSSVKGLMLTNGVKIICHPNAKITFLYTGDNDYVMSEFSPINFLSACRDGFTLIGAHIEAKNCRYVLHDDPSDTTNPYYNRVQSCYFKLDNRNNTGWHISQVIGGGFGRNGVVEIVDCVLDDVVNAENVNTEVCSYHVDVSSNTGCGQLTLTGCYLKGGTFRASYGGTSQDDTLFIVHDNSMYGEIITSGAGNEPAGGWVQNIDVRAWNNINRAGA